MSRIKYQKSVLESGATLVTEHHPHSRSFSVGFWMDCGSRFESEELSGVTHFLEHLTFKGTKKRSAFDIAKALEAYGGELNAFTSKEHTCFHGQVLKDDWKVALDVLADLVTNMSFSSKDFKNEKAVIIQEVAMTEDQADDIIYDYLLEPMFKDHPIGRPILGNIKAIHAFKEKQVYDYYEGNYRGPNLVISCAGYLNHKSIETHLNRLFKKIKTKAKISRIGEDKPTFNSVKILKDKQTEQTHILLAFPSTSFRDELRMEAFIVNSVLGGGMTSRLFQSVREEKGLAYSIHSILHTMTDVGFITVQAACELDNTRQLMDTVIAEIKKLKKNGLTKKDVEFFKGQVKGAILMGAEDIDNRMHSLAINELVFKEPKSIARVQKMISNISFDSVNEYLNQHLNTDLLSGVILGPNVNKNMKWWK